MKQTTRTMLYIVLPVLLALAGLFAAGAVRAAGSQAVRELTEGDALYADYCARAEDYLRQSGGSEGRCWGVPILETRRTLWGAEEAEVMAPLLTYSFPDVARGGMTGWQLSVEIVRWPCRDGALGEAQVEAEGRAVRDCVLSMRVGHDTTLRLDRAGGADAALGSRFERVSIPREDDADGRLTVALWAFVQNASPILGENDPETTPPRNALRSAALDLESAVRSTGFWCRQDLPVTIHLQADYRNNV